jgi:hypothetical protein
MSRDGIDFEDVKASALAELAKPVSQTYTGRPGCACGCRGHYSGPGSTSRRTIAKIRLALSQATAEDDWGLLVAPGGFVGIDNGPRDERTRTYTAYTDGRTL